jgi:C4-dicarboxylate transporter, DctQ subunit
MGKSRLTSFYDKLTKFNFICSTLSGLILLFVTFSIFVDVFLRYFFNRPSIWITEMSTYFFLYIIFLGTAHALQQGLHIRVTFVVDRLNGTIKRIVNLVTSVIAMFFVFVLLWQTSVMTWDAFRGDLHSITILNAPFAYIYMGMVFGSFFLFLTMLFQTILQFQAGNGGDTN